MSFCVKCGKELSNGAAACPNCGYAVNGNAPQATVDNGNSGQSQQSYAYAQQPYAQPQQPNAYPQQPYAQPQQPNAYPQQPYAQPQQPYYAQPVQNAYSDGLSTAAKVFLIIGCIAYGWMLLPLAWTLPITITIFGKMKRNEPIGTGLKVCALLFVNLLAGIFLLCHQDPVYYGTPYHQ